MRPTPWLAATLLAAAGCAEPTHPVTGRVVYPDGRPYTAGGSITFESTRPPYARAVGPVAPDGSFTLSTLREGSGSAAGEHRVCVIPHFTEPTLQGIARQKAIDPRYCDFQTTPLTVDVKPEANVIEIKVEPRPGARPPAGTPAD